MTGGNAMDSKRKKVLALVALGSLWGGLLLWQWLTWQEPARVPLANVSGPAASASHSGTDSLHVQLDLLAAARTQREMVFATPRNIFALPSAATVNIGVNVAGSPIPLVSGSQLSALP